MPADGIATEPVVPDRRRQCRATWARALVLGSLALQACRTTDAPLPAGDGVIVISGETPQVVLVDPMAGRVARRTDVPAFAFTASLSPDRATLYLAAGDLMAMDAHSLAVRWRERLSTTTDPRLDRWGGVVVASEAALAASPDESRLFVASAFKDNTPGLAVLDAATRNLVGFLGPLFVEGGGLVTLPPGPAAPKGAILVIGRREAYQLPRVDWLYVLDPVSLTLQDSTTIAPPPAPGGNSSLARLVIAADHRTAYAFNAQASGSQLYKYDLASRQVLASAPDPYQGQVALSGDDRHLYQTSGFSLNDPGSGMLLVYGADLQTESPIDLRSTSSSSTPPQLTGIAVSADNAHIYVTAGTASRGPTFGPQPGRLLVVDAHSGILNRAISLGIYAPAEPLAP